jgi:hypothetical protein
MHNFRVSYLLPLFIVLLTSITFAQNGTYDTIRVGTIDIVIPAPEGMVNDYGKNAALKTHFDSGMEPGNTALAAFVPAELDKRYEAGSKFSPADLSFYTSVFEPQSVANVDVTPQLFEGFIARVKQQFPDSIEPLTPAILSRIAEVGPSGKPMNLGNFNNTADRFSVAVLMSGQHGRNIVTAGTTLSYVLVRKRLLYLTVFKQIKKDTDLQSLLDYTQKWTAAIVAANK